jgi:hypothetical protein
MRNKEPINATTSFQSQNFQHVHKQIVDYLNRMSVATKPYKHLVIFKNSYRKIENIWPLVLVKHSQL